MTNEHAFLMELEALSRKYKIQISGCGCCGSPSLFDLQEKELAPEAGYAMPCGRSDFGWTYPGEYSWNKDKDNLVKVVK